MNVSGEGQTAGPSHVDDDDVVDGAAGETSSLSMSLRNVKISSPPPRRPGSSGKKGGKGTGDDDGSTATVVEEPRRAADNGGGDDDDGRASTEDDDAKAPSRHRTGDVNTVNGGGSWSRREKYRDSALDAASTHALCCNSINRPLYSWLNLTDDAKMVAEFVRKLAAIRSACSLWTPMFVDVQCLPTAHHGLVVKEFAVTCDNVPTACILVRPPPGTAPKMDVTGYRHERHRHCISWDVGFIGARHLVEVVGDLFRRDGVRVAVSTPTAMDYVCDVFGASGYNTILLDGPTCVGDDLPRCKYHKFWPGSSCAMRNTWRMIAKSRSDLNRGLALYHGHAIPPH